MFWTKLFFIFCFFARILPGGLSQSTVSADIPGNVRFTIPKGSTTLQTSTITSRSTTTSTSSELPSDQLQTTLSTSQINTSAPSSSARNPSAGSKSNPMRAGAIVGLVVGLFALLSTFVGAVWYLRSRRRKKSAIKKPDIELTQPEDRLPTKETALKETALAQETAPTQETQTVEPAPTSILPDPDSNESPQEARRRSRSSIGGL
ncbi:hypothetical protein TWF506_001939 [Arthrobotrys conoides]|uniref:Mid2 domain-containing protein n=1 Tax=Arthrobotrys conoides TaxID=74498 RepID=A0AAN8PAJ6_9PEZI